MILGIDPGSVAGLPAREADMLSKLISTYQEHTAGNDTKNR